MHTNFQVIGLTRREIKPESTAQETDSNPKLLVGLGKSPTEALCMLQQVYKEHTLFRATVFFVA